MAPADRIVVRPEDTGEALVNPGMGWVHHHYDNSISNYGSRLAPSDTVDDFPGLSVAYLRLAWSYLEPEEGRFDWSVVDTPAQRWIARGKQIAFRISCCESVLRFATPEWVKDAGAKGTFFMRPDGACADHPDARWEPDFDDPVFLGKLDSFLAAMAARYDGSPEVAFIDVGSMGVWGEGHTQGSSKVPYGGETTRRHLDLHLKHFKNTLLVYNDDLPSGPPRAPSQGSDEDGDRESVLYAAEQGMTLRDDSILVQGEGREYLSAWMAPYFWDTRPIVLESEHYGPSRDRGCWRDGSMYLQAVEDYRASYATIHWWPHEFLEACRDLIHQINMRLGYRLQPVEVTWPAAVSKGGEFAISSQWRNGGVAPCLPGGHPAFTLKDAEGGIVALWADESFDARNLPVGPPGQAGTLSQQLAARVPFSVEPGDYDLHVSVGTSTGTPLIALPLPDGDAERRYRLGSIQITE